MKRTTVYLEESADLALSRLAKQRQQPKAELLREALASFIAQQESTVERAEPSWLGAGDSGAAQGAKLADEAERDEARYGERLEREYEEILESYARAKAES